MSKQITLDRILTPRITGIFNINVGTAQAPDYYPLQLWIDMTAQNADGVSGKTTRIKKNVGTSQVTPFDFSTIGGIKDVYTALPDFLKASFKEGVLATIDDDPST